ncbi:PBSX family phage terminase large subunit [Peptostreptococcus sp. D1]|uniref:PBSX family phage terminase large subunit n=1 Tax=Peptostreptococcus sp. D1 TaxID=72304 RepID=UPI0008DEE8D1|nr:PBSX family phage terminase large subunit [Peptostreptococcus sp. D1]SFE90246.1 phage terminase, large subunit, PBSX family [Peptostreptococcus sp. D1]
MAKKNRRKRENKKFIFHPFSTKQLQLMNWWRPTAPSSICDMVIADGAIRSGKTIAMICGFLNYSQTLFQGENFIIAGKTIGSLKKNVIEPMKEILNAWGWKFEYNRSENYIVIDTNIYYMYDANNEASQDKLQGLTAAGALADEAALFPRTFIEQMIARCSVTGAKLWLNCNPGGAFHWLKTEFIDKAKSKMIYRLHFNMDDNLSLSEDVKNRYERLYKGVFYLRYVKGLWVQAEGVIYDMFNTDKHSFKTHLIGKCQEYYTSIDYGTQNAMVYLLWGKLKDRWYCIKEYYYSGREKEKQKSDNKYYEDLVKFLDGIIPTAIIIDPSAASFIQLIREKGKYKVRKAKNDVADGIRNVATALSNRIIAFHNECINCFKEFSTYIWDEKAAARGEDKPVKEHDHCLDAIRYFIHTIIFNGKPAIYSKEVTNTGLGIIKHVQSDKKIKEVYNKLGGVF